MNVAEHIVARLQAWGVHRVYGYPGDGIGGVLVALSERGEDVEFVQVRHEETAGFAATADVKYGGSRSVLGQTAETALGGNYYQEVDLRSVFG